MEKENISSKAAVTDFQKRQRYLETYYIPSKNLPDSGMEVFKRHIQEKYDVEIKSYWDLHKWSVDNVSQFWEEIWNMVGVISSQPYEQVFIKTGPGILDYQWFPGALFNYAENMLRIRDDREAIIYSDEDGNFERMTYAELFESVRLYAAAFRKLGLQKYDRVACYMSNRKEAIIAMFATTSIGAVWGGSQPFLGARSASKIISHLDPKFLITVDRFLDSGKEYNLMDNLPYIVERTPTLVKVIIVPTKQDTLQKDISHIPNSCFLESFLENAKSPSGEVPELVFEQLPFDHPVFISFTSGTTGLPKGSVHGAGSTLGHIMQFPLIYNMKDGDTAYSLYPMGWTLWNFHVSSLLWGIKVFLQSGNPFAWNCDKNVWDVLAEHKIAFVFFVTNMVDKMEKQQMKPSPNSNLEHLKLIAIGGTPVTIQNFKYLRSIVPDHVYIANTYGSTETVGQTSACDVNSPTYAPEVQGPALGKDVRCVDEKGNLLLGQRGELVIANPGPYFPLYLWKDIDNQILKKTYLTEYPGCWRTHDECYVNPLTKGIRLLGRIDDTLIQNGERFGAADVYFAIRNIEEILDFACVDQKKSDGVNRAVLFVKMREGHHFTPELRDKLARKIDEELWEDCVPEVILEVKDIPYNANNKRVESIIRKIIATNEIPAIHNIKNSECLQYYVNIPEMAGYL